MALEPAGSAGAEYSPPLLTVYYHQTFYRPPPCSRPSLLSRALWAYKFFPLKCSRSDHTSFKEGAANTGRTNVAAKLPDQAKIDSAAPKTLLAALLASISSSSSVECAFSEVAQKSINSESDAAAAAAAPSLKSSTKSKTTTSTNGPAIPPTSSELNAAFCGIDTLATSASRPAGSRAGPQLVNVAPQPLQEDVFSPHGLSRELYQRTDVAENDSIEEVFIDPQYIFLRVYCVLTNLRLDFVPIRYPTVHALGTLPAAIYENRVLDTQQIFCLLREARNLDNLAFVNSSSSGFLDTFVQEAEAVTLVPPLSADQEPAIDAHTSAERLATIAKMPAATERRDTMDATKAFATWKLAPDTQLVNCNAGFEKLQLLSLQLRSAALGSFVVQRLGRALQYLLWLHDPCRHHFTARVYKESLPFVYALPSLYWSRRKALHAMHAITKREIIRDVLEVLQVLAVHQLEVLLHEQQAEYQKRQPQQHHQQKSANALAMNGETGNNIGDTAANCSSGEYRGKTQEDGGHMNAAAAAAQARTRPSTAASATPLTQGMQHAFDNPEACFLLVKDRPTTADVYMYAYLVALLQFPSHLTPWHDEENSGVGDLVDSDIPAARKKKNSSNKAVVSEAREPYEQEVEEKQQKQQILLLLPFARRYVLNFNTLLAVLQGQAFGTNAQQALIAGIEEDNCELVEQLQAPATTLEGSKSDRVKVPYPIRVCACKCGNAVFTEGEDSSPSCSNNSNVILENRDETSSCRKSQWSCTSLGFFSLCVVATACLALLMSAKSRDVRHSFT